MCIHSKKSLLCYLEKKRDSSLDGVDEIDENFNYVKIILIKKI